MQIALEPASFGGRPRTGGGRQGQRRKQTEAKTGAQRESASHRLGSTTPSEAKWSDLVTSLRLRAILGGVDHSACVRTAVLPLSPSHFKGRLVREHGEGLCAEAERRVLRHG